MALSGVRALHRRPITINSRRLSDSMFVRSAAKGSQNLSRIGDAVRGDHDVCTTRDGTAESRADDADDIVAFRHGVQASRAQLLDERLGFPECCEVDETYPAKPHALPVKKCQLPRL